MHRPALLRRPGLIRDAAWGLGLAVPFGCLALGCGPEVDRPDGELEFLDGGPVEAPGTPALEAPATPVPWPVATLRGEADDARRVLVEGGANPLASSVLPDGSFCVDVEMPEPGEYAFAVFAQNDRGDLSPDAAETTVVFDPSAPAPSGVTTCDGSDPAGCTGAAEICDNGRDDDCNGLRDEQDPACVECAEDVFEPNDDASAPRLEPGRHEGLVACPGNEDWYGIYARRDERITVRVFFVHEDGNLDAELLGPGGDASLQKSTSLDDDELIAWTATRTGEHELRIWGPGGETNGYVLDVSIDAAAEE